MLESGAVRCSLCGEFSESHGNSGWCEKLKDAPARDDGADQRHVSYTNDPVPFAKERAARRASGEDVTIIVVVENSGEILTWCDIADGDQMRWAKDKLDLATKMICAPGKGD